MRSFVEYLRARRVLNALEQLAALSRFSREKAGEEKRVGRQATGYQRRQEGRRSGNRYHRHVMADGEGDQAESGVGDAGHAGVGDERDLRAAFKVDHQFGGLRHLVVLVIADQSCLDRKSVVWGKIEDL